MSDSTSDRPASPARARSPSPRRSGSRDRRRSRSGSRKRRSPSPRRRSPSPRRRSVSRSRRSRSRSRSRAPNAGGYTEDGTKLYIGNLSYHTTEKELTKTFERFGKIIDVFIPRDGARGGSRGFGFVTFERRDDAEDAERRMDEQLACVV